MENNSNYLAYIFLNKKTRHVCVLSPEEFNNKRDDLLQKGFVHTSVSDLRIGINHLLNNIEDESEVLNTLDAYLDYPNRRNKRNYFQKLPLHVRYLLYFFTGALMSYVFF